MLSSSLADLDFHILILIFELAIDLHDIELLMLKSG